MWDLEAFCLKSSRLFILELVLEWPHIIYVIDSIFGTTGALIKRQESAHCW